jgi:putative endonuclease
MTTSYEIGQISEKTASAYLQKQGLKLIEKNFRCAQGEIDLIMKDKNYLVFVEVRFRKHRDYGNSIETISHNKQIHLIRTAQYYLQQHSLMYKANCRFDVLGLNREEKITWIKNVFDVEY